MSVLDDLNLGWGKKLSLILQTEAAECGMACLAMVASYHGFLTDLPALRRRFAVSLKGMSLAQLIAAAGKLNFSCRPLRVDIEALGKLSTPCILHWNLNHFVVLKEVKRDQIVIHDPSMGLVKTSLTEASKAFTGVALELEPNLQFR
jgi:ATP-binding cassette, subfamily B, bacterial CvaB/MchF/RaxB